MNRYLEKIAGWKDPSKFINLVTGKAKRDAGTRVKILEEATAYGHTLKGAKRHKNLVDEATTQARLATAGVAGVGVAGAAYGYKKHRDKQRAETRKQYELFFKQAAVGEAAKTLAGAGGSGVWKILKHVGKTTADVMNTAGSGKIKQYAHQHGIKYPSKDYKRFTSKNHVDQVLSIRKGNTGKSRVQISQDLKNLKNQRRDARIAIGATGVAGLTGYAYHKAKRQLDEQNKTYY